MQDAQLEAEYDVLAGTGLSMKDVVADWASASRKAFDAAEPEPLTVTCGPNGDLAYDIFRPRGEARGAVLFLHGGFWVQGSKESVRFPQAAFTEAGLCYVAATYGLAPRYTLDDLIGNVEFIARSVLERAGELRVDPRRIALIGHSAGAYLAAALASSTRRAFTPIGSILISGLFDLRPLPSLARIEKLALTVSDSARLSIDGSSLARAGKVIVAIGRDEPAGFQHQSALLAQQLTRAGTPPRLLSVPHHNHFSIARSLADSNSPLFREVLALFA